MKEKLKIDIVSDVVCPWCTVGYKRLEKAIADLGIEDQIAMEWQPFQLNPQMPQEGQDLTEHLTQKYGSTPEEQKQSKLQLVEAGEELGFTFDYFDKMRMANTFDAHVLLGYAKKYDKQTELKLRLTTAFFSERKDVSKREILQQALVDVGLNSEEGLRYLEDENNRRETTTNENYWKSLGINSVPTIIFDKKSAVRGAQPVSIFKQVLTDLLKEK